MITITEFDKPSYRIPASSIIEIGVTTRATHRQTQIKYEVDGEIKKVILRETAVTIQTRRNEELGTIMLIVYDCDKYRDEDMVELPI